MGLLGHEIEYSESGTIEGYVEAVVRQQNQISLAILTGPVMPSMQIVRGDDPQRVVATQAGAAIETWLVYQALGHTASFGEGWMMKQMIRKAMFPTQVMLTAGAIGIASSVAIHGKSSSIEKMASLGGVTTGSTQKRRMQSLGGL
jgi:hypothetical protein